MSVLIHGITRIVSELAEQAGGRDEVLRHMIEAYELLRKEVPTGDLRIHLSVETLAPKEQA